MPFLPTTATMTGGQPDADNIYLIKGKPLPSGTTLVNPVPIFSTDGTTNATIYVDGVAAGFYQGAINIQPGVDALIPGGAGAGLTIRTTAGTGSAATTVEVGANAQGANHLYIAGLSGVGEVYDEVYNQVIKATPVVNVQTSLNSAVPAERTRQFTFTAPQTGAYMLQIDINYYNVDTTPSELLPVFSTVNPALVVGALPSAAGAIEWTLTTLPPLPAGEVQFMSSTIAATDLIKQAQLTAVAEPMDFTISNVGFLTGGNQYNINLYAIKPSAVSATGDWNLSDIRVRLIQMC